MQNEASACILSISPVAYGETSYRRDAATGFSRVIGLVPLQARYGQPTP